MQFYLNVHASCECLKIDFLIVRHESQGDRQLLYHVIIRINGSFRSKAHSSSFWNESNYTKCFGKLLHISSQCEWLTQILKSCQIVATCDADEIQLMKKRLLDGQTLARAVVSSKHLPDQTPSGSKLNHFHSICMHCVYYMRHRLWVNICVERFCFKCADHFHMNFRMCGNDTTNVRRIWLNKFASGRIRSRTEWWKKKKQSKRRFWQACWMQFMTEKINPTIGTL